MAIDQTNLAQIIARLSNMEPFNISTIDAQGSIQPWYNVDGRIVSDLIINPHLIPEQMAIIGGQIAHWGRMVAQCKRIWEQRERELRVWKAEKSLEVLTSVEPNKKKPTIAEQEIMYRTDEEYNDKQRLVEVAEEAYNAASAIVDGFKAKRDALRMVGAWQEKS